MGGAGLLSLLSGSPKKVAQMSRDVLGVCHGDVMEFSVESLRWWTLTSSHSDLLINDAGDGSSRQEMRQIRK